MEWRTLGPSIPFTHRSTHPRPTCLPNLKKHLKQVRQAATHGAASITKVRQIIADAADSAVARFGEAILRGKPVEDWSAWAFRVGANAAKVIGAAGRRRGETALPPQLDDSPKFHSGTRRVTDREREAMRAEILAKKSVLIGRQVEVLLKLTEPNMSLHRAAQEIGMDRTALRRSLKAGMARLAKHHKVPPPHL